MERILADEDIALNVVVELRKLGHDVTTVLNIGRANERWPDQQVFLAAIAQNRILLTKNRRHFYRLHRDHPDHPGIVACTDDPDFARNARRIDASISSAGGMRSKYVKVFKPAR